jgi:hypothetical protein
MTTVLVTYFPLLLADTPTRRHADTPTRRHADTPTRRHADTPRITPPSAAADARERPGR